MFNQPIFGVLTLSFCAIITPVASKTIFGRNNFQSSIEESFDFESDDHYDHDAYVNIDDKDKSEEFFYVDATLLGQQVAKADYVPPAKHAYETTNEELTKLAESSKIYTENKVQQDEDRIFHSDQELKTDEECEQEILKEIEVQIIPISNDKNDSPDDGISRFENGQPNNDNSKEILDESAREFEIRQNNDNNEEVDSVIGRTLEYENHQDTDIDEDLRKILDYHDPASQLRNHQNIEHDNLNNRYYSTLGVENHQNVGDLDADLEKALDYYEAALQAENHQNSDEHDNLNDAFDSNLEVENHENIDINDSLEKVLKFYDTL